MIENKTMNLSRFILCFALLVLGSGSLFGQVSGTKTIPTDYATIAAFVTDINANGIGSGGVTLNVPSGYTETAPAGGFTITATGTSADPIIIQGTGGAPKPIITASGALVAGNLNDGIIKLVGSDYVTISGLDLRENAANTTTAAATNNMTEWGIALLYATSTNNALNVTIRDNTITLNRIYQNTFGIYANATHSATAPTTSATGTGASGGNSGLKIYANTISNVNLGITVVGPTAVADQNNGIDIGGVSSATGNTITDFGTTTTFSGYANVSGTVNGILVRNSINANVRYNTITSSTAVTSGTIRGIFFPAFTNAPTATFTSNISDNTISIQSGAASGAIIGLHIDATNSSATSVLNIQNNSFSSFGHTVASSGNIACIQNGTGSGTMVMSGNTFNSINVNTTGTLYLINNNCAMNTFTVSGNSTTGTTTKTGAGGIVYGYYNFGSPTGGTATISNNNFSNVSVTGATNFYGIRQYTTTSQIENIVGNTISNVTGGTSAVYGISHGYGAAGSEVSGNIVNNLSASAVVHGIQLGDNTGGSVVCFNNRVYDLSSSTGNAVNGITQAAGVATSIYGNKIYGISSSHASGSVNGILISAGTTTNIYNNVISGLTAPVASGADVIKGINIASTSSSSTVGVYYNSVYLNASSSGTNFGTTGIFHQVSSTATTSALDMRNNIIINESTAAGTGLSVAFRRSGVALNNFASTSNRNLLYAGVPSAANLLMYDGTTAYQTLASYQTAVLPREANSVTGEALFTGAGYGTAGNFFVSLTGASSDFLRPVAGITTQTEGGATPVTNPAITTDFDGVARPASPDMGAYEFSGITPTPVITLNSVTPPTSTQCAATARLVSVDITTTSGTITGATIGYSVNGVPQTNIVMTNTSGSTWEASIPAPTPSNATVAWGVAAVSSIGITGSYTGTSYSDDPLLGLTVAATASSATICSGNPTTLTASLTKNVSATIGTATTLTGSTSQPTAFCNRWSSYHMQTVYTAAELTAAGLQAGTITSMAYNITTLGDAATNDDFIVKIGTTALSTFTDFVSTAGYTTVFPSATYTHAVGVNVINFSTPFNWDGVSNIVIDVTHSGANNINNSQTYYTATPGNTVVWSTNGGASGTTSTNRLNIVFTADIAPAIQSISWSDGVGTVGTTNPLSVTPATTTTYTAAITASGCTVSPSPTVNVTVNPLPSAPTATNSAQCGVQIPTASVTSTSGLPTPAFNWYAASSGGTALQSGTSATYTSTVSATTTFYVSELNTATGCEGARVPVTVSVSTPDQVSLTPSVTEICLGDSFTLTAANIGAGVQTYTYSTESATAGSGAETPLTGASVSVTPTASGSFTYTLTAVDGGCAASATATVLVNALPAITAVTATPTAVCSGDNITLSASIASSNDGPFVVGAGANLGSSGYYSPFYHLFGGVKSQFIIPASELTAAGLTAGNITSVALNIGTVGTTYAGFTVHVGTTASANLSGGLIPTASLTQVYSNASLALTAGSLNTFTFSSPFAWDGTSNLIVQTSWSNSNSGGSYSEVQYDNTAYVSCAYYREDGVSPAAILAATSATNTISARPKMTFVMNHNNGYTWSWSPGTGLNTPTATTSITNTTGSAITQAFTVTATNSTTGCVATATTPVVTINSAVPTPVANNSTQCGVGVPAASVTGTGISGHTYSWYLVSTGGTALTGETGSSLTGYSISSTTTFYVSENSATCSSARIPVTVTVTPAPVISIAGSASVCEGSSTVLTASSSNDPNYTYTWSGGLGTGASVSASPTVATTYTVTGTDMSGGANNGCVNIATHSITVNPAPSTAAVVPATTTICAGDVQQLTSGPTTSTAIFGNGTTAPSTTSYPNPLSAYYGGAKHQLLFTATELAAQGLVAGSQISSITFDLNTFAANACTNFTIRMGNTALTALTGFVGGTSTVYGPTTFTPSAAGLVTFTLTTPYTWNGTSNIIVETVHNAGNNGNGSGTRTNTTTTLTNTVYYGASDNVTGGIAGFDALSTWGTSGASSSRPNVRFVHTNAAPVWSPAGSLYTDAAATTAYTGTGTTSVYAKPSATTTYVVTYTGSNGCTAQTTATITVNQPTSSSVPVTACGSYTWAQNGMTYNTSGAYTDTIPNAAGCDSVITLNLTINQPSADTITEVACMTYTWAQNGMTYVVSGLYNDTITNAAGCDSIITLDLTIGGPSASTVTEVACGSYIWAQNGMTYNVSGSYTDTIPNMFGCDSVITLDLTINQPSASSVTVSECTSYTWVQNGMTYVTSGVYTDTIPNAAGCDSVITLNLTIIQPTTSSVSVVECTSYTWAQNGMTYVASGAYTDTIPNAAGCDSIITLNLTINQPTSSTVTENACGSYTWAQNGMTYTASGAYTDTIPNAAGCDSVITLNLTIFPDPVATVTNNGDGTMTATAGASYIWLDCATNTAVAGATSQTFTPTANGSYAAVVTTANGCVDTSACVAMTNVGIKENTVSLISVHPNPTHDVVIVTMDAPSAVVEVIDVQGKLIQTTSIKSGDQVDLGAYERGVYTLRIKTEFGTSVERIVKN